MPKITMKDIARKAGISQQAVSQIINNKATMVSQATKDKVLQLVKELNYHPNYMAQSLRSGKRYCIGVAGTASLAHMDDYPTAQVYAGIGEVVEAHDHFLMFFPLGKADLPNILIKAARANMVDGLIIMVYSSLYQKFIESTSGELHKENIPFVAVHSTTRPFNCHNVGFNAPAMGAMAAQHLIGQGYREIGVVCSDRMVFSDEYYGGYEKAIKKAGLTPHPLKLKRSTFNAIDGYEEGRELIGRHGILDGYITQSDAFAYGLIKALREAGARIPEQTGVVGCEDVMRPEQMPSTLTAITRNFRERGRLAAEILFRAIEAKDKEMPYKTVMTEPKLMVRETTRKNG